MIISALFRSASTIFCYDLANKLDLIYLDEIYDPLNDDILRMKRHSHELKTTLRQLDTKKFTEMKSKVAAWRDHSCYLINNHNYDVPWFEAAQVFFCRKDILGSLVSMHNLIVKSGQPADNLWIYADWIRRFMEYTMSELNGRPLIIAENLNYSFRNSGADATSFVSDIFRKKISNSLEMEFNEFISLNSNVLSDLSAYARK